MICNIAGISLDAATAAAKAAVALAGLNGWRINVAVVDRAGHLVVFMRMPGSYIHSIDLAIDKAFTSASFGFRTKDWMKEVGHDEGMKLGFSSQKRLIVFGGGIPIRAEGEQEWIGGIGVSGASESQDEACAIAGLAAIGINTVPSL